jgi:branched-chain amino acid aminotransferase
MEPGVTAWLDGEFVDWREVCVSPLSHSFNRASAVFEVMSVVQASGGTAIFCLAEHMGRFFSSAAQAFMDLPFSRERITEAVIETTRANRVASGLVKCYAFHPEMDIGPMTPAVTSVAVFSLDYRTLGVPLDKYARPVRMGISSFRKLHPATAAVHAKITGNYTNGFLARMEARKKGYDEALMLDTDGFIAEAPTANVFFARDGIVVTPDEGRVLPGITRGVVMDVLSVMGVTVRRECIGCRDLGSFQECFLSGTLRHVQPVSEIEGIRLSCPGPITSSLVENMQKVYDGTSERFRDRLAFV